MTEAPPAPFALSRRRLVAGGVSLIASAAATRAATVQPRVRIACVGDSMIDGVWGGLARLAQREACLSSRVELGRYGRNGTGLARGDTLDWVAELAHIETRYRPALVLASLGLNDQQPIIGPARERIAFGSRQWGDAYRARVSAFLARAASAEAGLVWLGNPVMRDAAMQTQTRAIDTLVAETIARAADPRLRYVASWRLTDAGEDSYRQYGPAAGGARVQLRAADGVHFTPAGYDLVAEYVLPAILAQLQAARIELVYPCLRLG